MAGWEIAQSMNTNNPPALLLDFHGLGGYFSAALGKVGASGGVLWALGGLVDDSAGFIREAWQQDGAKWTKLRPSWPSTNQPFQNT